MKKLITISLAVSVMPIGQVCTAQSYNKKFVESERRLASKCITVYQNAPKDGTQIVFMCLAHLEDMKALKNNIMGLTDVDNRLFYFYSAMANDVLTLGELAKNGGRVSSTACIYGQEVISFGKKVNFQNGSDYGAAVQQQMIKGFKRDLIPPHCKAI